MEKDHRRGIITSFNTPYWSVRDDNNRCFTLRPEEFEGLQPQPEVVVELFVYTEPPKSKYSIWKARLDPYPEHTKLRQVRDGVGELNTFLDWLMDTHDFSVLGHLSTLGYKPRSRATFLAEYFELDDSLLRAERTAMTRAGRVITETIS